MALADPAKIRNIAVVGHRGAGKTSLVEALLFTAGAKNRLGAVMDGTTTMDHDEDEIKRQMTISAGLAHVDWANHKTNLVDTPGEASFINEALGTLSVVEGVLMVVNAVTKVEVQTERVWKRATEMGVSRVVAVNMMDRERADFGEAVKALRARFGDEVVAIALPIGEEAGFKGLVDLIDMKAYTYSGTTGKGTEGPVPADVQAAAEEAREALVDRVAEADDALLEKYLEGTELTHDEITAALRTAVAAGSVSPVIPVAATKNIGSDRLLDLLLAVPSPVTRGVHVALKGATGTDEVELEPEASGSTPPHGAVRVQDHLRPILRPGEPGAAVLGQDRYRHSVAEQPDQRKGADGQHPHDAGQGDQDDGGSGCRRHRRAGQAEGYGHW
jgi:elongation factor G